MFSKILIANRGEIACRVIRTAKQMGIQSVAVYSEADKSALHVELADEAYCLGPAPVAQSYLRVDKIIEVAKKSGAQAIHPGYGFLSENPNFVAACNTAGIVFIGPSVDAIKAMGLKDAAKALMEKSGVPVVPGYHGDNQDAEFLKSQANLVGYPILIKARAGGGGKGMRLVESADDFNHALESAQREAKSSFADDNVIIEKFITSPRHIEIQVFADQHGNTVHLFERDCSMQRRHQKVIEEAPAPGMTDALRQVMGEAAVKAAKAVNYVGAGTVEFIVDSSQGLKDDGFYFMEMNTRLQVEHPVTEAITGLDLVEWQFKVAAGEELPKLQNELLLNGHAIEARLYAEDPQNNFLPAMGKLEYLEFPQQGVRVDSGVRQGDEITPYYDPMIAKLIVHSDSRSWALANMKNALAQTRAIGCDTNISFLSNLLCNQEFEEGELDTGLIDRNFNKLTQLKTPSEQIVAIAALSAMDYFTQQQCIDPWQTLTGWRHFSAAKQYAHLSFNGEDFEVLLVTHANQRLELVVNGECFKLEIKSVDCNNVRIDFKDKIIKATVVNQMGSVVVFSGCDSFQFKLPDNLHELESAQSTENNILAPMPGLITAIHIKQGQRIANGNVLIVMEAMKMEHSLKGSLDAIVAELKVSVGDQVTEGELLLRLEGLEEND